MSKKLVTYVVVIAMIMSVFSTPILTYAEIDSEDSITETEEDGVVEGVTEDRNSVAGEKVTKLPQKTEKKVTVSATKIKKAKPISYKSIQISWKKVPKASGYQVYKYSKSKKKYTKVKNIRNAKIRKYRNNKLRSNRSYKFKVRAYKKVKSRTYYGKYSKTVKAKTPKTGQQKIVDKAKTKVGSAYRYGASGPNAFDCSGFVYWVYNNAGAKTKKKFSRTSSAGLYSTLRRYKVASGINGMKRAQKGDIVLFTRGGRYSHAAIYIGKGRIIHARTPAKGVQAQSLRQVHNSGTRVAAIISIAKK